MGLGGEIVVILFFALVLFCVAAFKWWVGGMFLFGLFVMCALANEMII
jgi:hypothetical protein